jgi:hypothetical protein
MRDIVRFSVGAGLAAALFAAAIGGAQARSQYDGTWTVSITTTKGACDSGATFTIQVRDGIVSGAFNARGQVSSSGYAQVSVSSGNQGGSGSGRLRGNSGGGAWHAVGSRGTCSGSWSASR